MTQAIIPGLYIVASPIGNLADISLRAKQILSAADLIACEDSRITGKLLHHLGIKCQMIRYDDHSGEKARENIAAMIQSGKVVILISDAGTPLISDPGYKLVRLLREQGHYITSIPGPSAAIVALTLSGLPSDHFYFHGFLPNKCKARSAALAALKSLSATLVFYENAKRLGACLADAAAILGAREAAVVREISKLHEQVKSGGLAELAEYYREHTPKGEIVVLIGPPDEADNGYSEDMIEAMMIAALAEMPLGKAVKQLAAETGLNRNQLYQRALELKEQGDG